MDLGSGLGSNFQTGWVGFRIWENSQVWVWVRVEFAIQVGLGFGFMKIHGFGFGFGFNISYSLGRFLEKIHGFRMRVQIKFLNRFSQFQSLFNNCVLVVYYGNCFNSKLEHVAKK